MPADLPVAAPDPARIEALREEAARGGLYQAEDGPVVRVPSWEEVTFLLDFADALLAERQQDKELRERVEKIAAEPCKWAEQREPACPDEWPNDREEWCRSCISRDVLCPPVPFYGGIPQDGPAALAVEEDATK